MNVLPLIVGLAASPLWAQEGYQADPQLIPVGGFILFYNSRGPLSFASADLRERPQGTSQIGEVRGRSCQYGLSIPISATFRGPSVSGAAGNGGYEQALKEIRRAHSELAGIYDVKVDIQTVSILGVFRRDCTEVTARGFK